jgi:hypothetical protein
MAADTTTERNAATPEAEGDFLTDVYRRLVSIHIALAERTNAERGEIMPWTLAELMSLIRDVHAARSRRDDVAEQPAVRSTS